MATGDADYAPASESPLQTLLRRAVFGQIPLWKVFWGYSFLGGMVLQFAMAIVSGIVPAPILAAVSLAFSASALFFVWRAAPNCRSYGWAIVARVYVGVSALASLLAVAAVMVAGGGQS